MYTSTLVCNYASKGNFIGDISNDKLTNFNNTDIYIICFHITHRIRNVQDWKGLLQMPAWVQMQWITLCSQIIIGFEIE